MNLEKYNRQGDSIHQIIDDVLEVILGLTSDSISKVKQTIVSANEIQQVKENIRKMSGASFKRLIMLLEMLQQQSNDPDKSASDSKDSKSSSLAETFKKLYTESISDIGDLANATDTEVRTLHNDMKRTKDKSNTARQQSMNRKQDIKRRQEPIETNPQAKSTQQQIHRLKKQRENLDLQIARLRDSLSTHTNKG